MERGFIRSFAAEWSRVQGSAGLRQHHVKRLHVIQTLQFTPVVGSMCKVTRTFLGAGTRSTTSRCGTGRGRAVSRSTSRRTLELISRSTTPGHICVIRTFSLRLSVGPFMTYSFPGAGTLGRMRTKLWCTPWRTGSGVGKLPSNPPPVACDFQVFSERLLVFSAPSSRCRPSRRAPMGPRTPY